MSGFNNSMAARDGQAAKSTEVSLIAGKENPQMAHAKEGNPDAADNPVLQAVQLPMVALMFLTRGALPHEETWRLFLESIPQRGAPIPQARCPCAAWP